MYQGLATFALAVASATAALAVVGVVMAEMAPAGAAALCSIALFIPGFAFLHRARGLRKRHAALAHVARFADASGVLRMETLAEELSVPRDDAEKILRRAIAEGHVQGAFDDRGRFLSADVRRCTSCWTDIPKDAGGETCPRCGAALPRGREA